MGEDWTASQALIASLRRDLEGARGALVEEKESHAKLQKTHAELQATREFSLSQNEFRIVTMALKTLIHVHMGRVDSAMEPFLDRVDPEKFGCSEPGEIRELLVELTGKTFTGIRHGGPSLGSPRVHDDARVAYRVLERLLENPRGASRYDDQGRDTRSVPESS